MMCPSELDNVSRDAPDHRIWLAFDAIHDAGAGNPHSVRCGAAGIQPASVEVIA